MIQILIVQLKSNKTRRREKLYVNIAYTQYPVIKEVAKMFNYKITRNDDADWDLIWLDGQLPPDRMLRMKSHQKANHYPGMYGISRKNHLGRNLMKMMKIFPEDYRFFPKTWLLPYEAVDFKNNFNSKGKSRKTFIVKPEAGSQGDGIFLTKTLNKIDPEDHCVAQEYIHKPYLIDDLKFDLRIYVMVYGTDPLRIYLYKEGLARFATTTY
jgi:tubulin polyglutamylase TTLL6/13